MTEPHSPDDRITPASPTGHDVTPGLAGGHSHAEHPSPFSDAELQELHTNDILAGKFVVMLMAGIFSVGLVLYTVILIAVAT
jgi:hypothetical protein